VDIFFGFGLSNGWPADLYSQYQMLVTSTTKYLSSCNGMSFTGVRYFGFTSKLTSVDECN
jgi:hypothetical protein